MPECPEQLKGTAPQIILETLMKGGNDVGAKSLYATLASNINTAQWKVCLSHSNIVSLTQCLQQNFTEQDLETLWKTLCIISTTRAFDSFEGLLVSESLLLSHIQFSQQPTNPM